MTEKIAPFQKALIDFCRKRGFEPSRVFDDFLRYVIHGYTRPSNVGLSGWKYAKEDNEEFFNLHNVFITNLRDKLKTNDWYDILGETYEDVIAGKGRKSNNGQFFTPPTICDLMTEINVGGNRGVVSDPTCGSGRTLLSYNAKVPGCYYVAEDLDGTCAMMTVVNFLFHGINGEVIHHDSLKGEGCYSAWLVNDGLNSFLDPFWSIPNIKPISYEETRVYKMEKNAKRIGRLRGKLSRALEVAEKEGG